MVQERKSTKQIYGACLGHRKDLWGSPGLRNGFTGLPWTAEWFYGASLGCGGPTGFPFVISLGSLGFSRPSLGQLGCPLAHLRSSVTICFLVGSAGQSPELHDEQVGVSAPRPKIGLLLLGTLNHYFSFAWWPGEALEVEVIHILHPPLLHAMTPLRALQ